MLTIGGILRKRANISPDLEALISNSDRYTYRELNQRANQLANYLLKCNIQKGDRVAILCSTHHPFVTIFMAIAKIGAIAVPLNWRLNPAELEWMAHDSQPQALFYEEEFSDGASILSACASLHHVIKVGRANSLEPEFAAIFREESMSEPLVDVHEDDPAVLTYTSGTTGKPKGVVSTHQTLHASGVATFMMLDMHMKDRMLMCTPLFHISGIAFISNAPLAGITTVCMPQFHPVHIWDLVRQEQITHMFAIPVMLKYMLPAVINGEAESGTLREILCGGTNVPRDLIEQYDSLGFPIAQVYGASEYSGVISLWRSQMGKETCGSAGKWLIGEVKILDPDNGRELPVGEVGEIICKGPQLFQGYWNNPKETEKVLQDGWFHTGDAGKLDEQGFLYVVDRYKDMINCSGEKVFPAQVEAVIREIEGVEEVAVIGIEDKIWGEVPQACVVKSADSSLSEEEILHYCHQKLAQYKLTGVTFVEELPKNAAGKVLKYVLREDFRKKIKTQ
ncbi:AMP-binding protein [Kroppenstedtia pulmonis]|uniref:AMP-binding protein n=1 Tax=Kroppenstedtia pulmonis TaxID=1380685 RepID=A0A7D4BGF7_9BACL|nr:AMP-binding protein [Kroppenstedtia pulmonis]QKG85032.1 AMP-binding protein [Kroppenstedtia pulmonis]